MKVKSPVPETDCVVGRARLVPVGVVKTNPGFVVEGAMLPVLVAD